MSNSPIAELIASRLSSLVHPGDDTHPSTALPLPMFSTSAIPPEMADQFAEEAGLTSSNIAKLTAEAIVYLIETDGQSTIVPTAELEKLRSRATQVQAGVQKRKVHCSKCGGMLFGAAMDATNPSLDGPQLIKAMQSYSVQCPHAAQSAPPAEATP